ncbi:predicted protein [Chaetomium globosum CBS 148.51]|uniref:Uncharacterized protein n=1 Tax=Chaetomium globosum (strain ATCC 6205 / CBS 148.51 / DSM 1962 / NBRC 6347 / NRRL 1970) TaxID=306901 RepID=Q2HA84_CHAGB|nr:uncharacterized protein CHGG_02870 [Chaetomium globosum CBS 148.51]EAQ90935.1 predicted protein [Chaetomium globosum CBS 148.51]
MCSQRRTTRPFFLPLGAWLALGIAFGRCCLRRTGTARGFTIRSLDEAERGSVVLGVVLTEAQDGLDDIEKVTPRIENVAAMKSRATPIGLSLAARLRDESRMLTPPHSITSRLGHRDWSVSKEQQEAEKNNVVKPEDRCDTHYAEVAFLDPERHRWPGVAQLTQVAANTPCEQANFKMPTLGVTLC